MPKLTLEDLEKIREKTKKMTSLRDNSEFKAKVTVHMGTCGIAAGARGVMAALMEEIEARNISDILLTNSGCAGLCSKEPMLTVELKGKAPVKYIELTKAKTKEILEKHVLDGKIVEKYALGIGSEKTDN